jgi:RNA polymerase sigma-32 factor
MRKHGLLLLVALSIGTPQLLARNLDVEVGDVEEMTGRMAADDLSLDAPLQAGDEEGHGSRMERLATDRAPAADVALGNQELQRVFRAQLAAFAATITDEKERYIFEHRLLPPEGAEPLTLQEIGDRYRLTRERARQIEAKLTARLREHVKRAIPDFELLGPPADHEG